jgi:hypothetical protein
LERHRLVNGWTWPELAAKLSLELPELVRLALCAVPKEATFVEDVATVAQFAGLPAAVLATVLREVEAHRNWDDVQPTGNGWTIAAHPADPPPGPTDEPKS